MRRIMTLTLCLLTLLVTIAQDFTDSDRQQMEYAIYFMDNGMPDKSIEILTALDAKYPDTPDILYEIGYAYYIKADYKSALKVFKRLEKMPPVSERVYQMEGNTLDMLGKRKEARKKYNEGLKHYPNSYITMLELGNLDLLDKKYVAALGHYEDALTANPAYASAFYRAGHILLNSDYRVWGLFYGEAMRLLEPNSDRSAQMSQWMCDTFGQIVKAQNDSAINININSLGSPTLESSYEMFLGLGVAAEFSQSQNKAITLASIIHGREVALSTYQAHYKGSISLLDYQQLVKDAGHWQAYNYWLFRPGFEAEASAWFDEHDEAFDDFVEWYKTHSFKPTSDAPTHRLHRGTLTPADEDEDIAEQLRTAEGCRKHDKNALRLAGQWLADKLDPESRKLASSFVLMWMSGTADYKFTIGGELFNSFITASATDTTTVNSDLTEAYLMSMAAYALENGITSTTAEMHCAVINGVLEYYERHADELVLTAGLAKALAARREGRLRELTDADFAKLGVRSQR